MYSYHIWTVWFNVSYTVIAEPIRALELHYPMIQFLIVILIKKLIQTVVVRLK